MILLLLLSPRAWRVVLLCSHSISVSVIINYTNMAATSHVKLGFLKLESEFLLNLDIIMKKKLVLHQILLSKEINLGLKLERGRVGGFPCLF